MQILLKCSIISHHKKSASISYNAKSQAILSLELHRCVESPEYTFLYRKHFSLFFFLPLYRVIKKVKARCIKQKSAGQGAAAEGVPIPLTLDQPVAPASSLSQASYTGGRGRGGSDC